MNSTISFIQVPDLNNFSTLIPIKNIFEVTQGESYSNIRYLYGNSVTFINTKLSVAEIKQLIDNENNK